MKGKRKILIVDDDHGFTEMVKLVLEATGNYGVRVENSADQAIDTALDYKPDLILMDIIMPDKEGPDVANQIRNTPPLHKTPVVFLTATITREEVNDRKGKIGGHAFLAKPSTVIELIECIESQLAAAS